MGKQALIIVLALSLAFGVIGLSIYNKENKAVTNYLNYYEHTMAKNVASATVQLALRQLADTVTWRKGYKNLSILGGTANLFVKDSTFFGQKGIKLGCYATFGKSSYTDTVFVKPAGGFVPPAVRAAFTAFGPLDKSVSTMYVDGRDHDTSGNYMPGTGKYAVSSGAATFDIFETAWLGGTDYSGGSPNDIAPVFPIPPQVVETNSYWKNGFPQSADAALEIPEGTLVSIAKKGTGGSRYLTSPANLSKAPVQGVTYVKLQPGTSTSVTLPANPSGILVFHSDSVDAYATHVTISNNAPFKGIMIFDKVFHMHMDLYGAMIELTDNTVTDRECNGNKDHKIYYSSDCIKNATAILAPTKGTKGGWRSKFAVLSWME